MGKEVIADGETYVMADLDSFVQSIVHLIKLLLTDLIRFFASKM